MSGQTLTVKLFRGDNTSWGFRLQGGKDFSSPLSVQRVNPGSLSEQAGLMTGDAILKIQGRSVDNMKHKEAQDAIIAAGNCIEIQVQRGGVRVWKPTVTPIGDLPVATSPPITGLYTKTSLAAKPQESVPIGTKHNVAPRPFAPLGGGKILVNNQYNTPAPLYSMNNIADTLSAHTEVLSSGAMGINFMKDPQPVNKDSAVYRMIMEEKGSGGTEYTNHVDQPYRKDSPMSQTQPVTQHVTAPVTKPASERGDRPAPPNACPECGKSIIGVFVRIKDKSLHPECFKCSTCGTSLKNVGYFNVNDKLYCDAHAKLAAKIAASTPTFEPLTISQPPEIPFSNPMSPTPHTPVTAPLSPSAYRTASPVPFHKQGDVHHVDAPQSPSLILTQPSFKAAQSAFQTAPSAPIKPPPMVHPMTPPVHVPVAPPLLAPVIASSPTQVPSMMSGNVGTPGTGGPGGPGHKFVWPPQKTQTSQADPSAAIPSNIPTPLPSYRPPPGTQHAPTPAPKYSSPTMSPVPPKLGPMTSPKPMNPSMVQQHSKTTSSAYSSSMTSTLASKTSSGSVDGQQHFVQQQGSRPAPKRGRGQMKQQVPTGARIPICQICGTPIRGPFVTALSKSWCPDHFICANNRCQTSLVNIGFVEDRGQLYCENCYEIHLAPTCAKCASRIKGDCLNALDKQWHPNCFVCSYCSTPFGNSSFYMEDGMPYCEKDWNELFTTKCVGCGFPIEAGDRWVEALNNNYHSQCFKCTKCLKGLEGQSFYAKSGKPYCKIHSRD